MLPNEFRYRTAWTMPDTYEQNKPALVAYLSKVLARAADGSFDLEPCRQRLMPFFSGEALYDRVFGASEHASLGPLADIETPGDMRVRFRSTKTYGHDIGLSCCFRQWRSATHCRFLHGYALAVHLEFEADDLDARSWVMDFGSLKPVRQWLEQIFDHKTLVAADDPLLSEMQAIDEIGLVQLVVLPHVSCEAFAEHIFAWVSEWLVEQSHSPRIRLAEVRVREHGANAAKVLA